MANELRLLISVLTEKNVQKTDNLANSDLEPWRENSWAASQRYFWLKAELEFRGLTESIAELPIKKRRNKNRWPEPSSPPAQQLEWVSVEGSEDHTARIPYPKNSQQLWAQHKYSILARDANLYREFGHKVAKAYSIREFPDLANQLTFLLRAQPKEGGLRNALQHMWGHVSNDEAVNPGPSEWSLAKLDEEIKRRVTVQGERYLLHSTALTDLQTWFHGRQ